MTILNGNDATLCWQPLPNTRKHFAILEAILRWRSLNCFNFSVITLGVTTCHTEIWYAAFSARTVLKAPSMRFLFIMFRYPIKHFRQRQVDLTHQNGYVSNFQSEWSLMWNHKGVCIRSGQNTSTKEWIVANYIWNDFKEGRDSGGHVTNRGSTHPPEVLCALLRGEMLNVSPPSRSLLQPSGGQHFVNESPCQIIAWIRSGINSNPGKGSYKLILHSN